MVAVQQEHKNVQKHDHQNACYKTGNRCGLEKTSNVYTPRRERLGVRFYFSVAVHRHLVL